MKENKEIKNPYSDRRYETTTPEGERIVLEPGETYKTKNTKTQKESE